MAAVLRGLVPLLDLGRHRKRQLGVLVARLKQVDVDAMVTHGHETKGLEASPELLDKGFTSGWVGTVELSEVDDRYGHFQVTKRRWGVSGSSSSSPSMSETGAGEKNTRSMPFQGKLQSQMASKDKVRTRWSLP